MQIRCVVIGIIDSREYVKEAIKDLKYPIEHISFSIEAKKPKISPKIDDIRESISNLLSIEKNQIGITATTGEGLTRTAVEEKVFR